MLFISSRPQCVKEPTPKRFHKICFEPKYCWLACNIIMPVAWKDTSHVRFIGTFILTRARFLSLTWSKLRLCSANHRAGYFSNLACDWLSIVWAYSKWETDNGPRFAHPRYNFSPFCNSVNTHTFCFVFYPAWWLTIAAWHVWNS